MNNLVNKKKMKIFVLKKNEKITGDYYRKKSGLLGKNLPNLSESRGTLWSELKVLKSKFVQKHVLKNAKKWKVVKVEMMVRKMNLSKNITEKLPNLTNKWKNQREKFVENLVDFFAK